uniref:DRBM domain-containing protein n=1 Tax=Acrobeloides nanus TaxID=290746 RepID=A0A914C5J1_9BILA
MEPENFDNMSATSSTEKLAETSKNRTLVSILEEGCMKLYKEKASCVDLEKDKVFEFKYIVQGIEGIGKSEVKQTAKHLAAGEILLKLTDDERKLEAFFPGFTKEAAKRYIAKQMDQTKKEDEVSRAKASENWIGKLNELTKKHKIGDIHYEQKEEGPAHNKTFTVTCTVLEFVTHGTGKKKQEAKAEAANLMCQKLEEADVLTKTSSNASLHDPIAKTSSSTTSVSEGNLQNNSNGNTNGRETLKKSDVSPSVNLNVLGLIKQGMKESSTDATELLHRIVDLNDSDVEKTFGKSPSVLYHREKNGEKNSNGYIPIYLKICTDEKDFLNVFVGLGSTEQESKNDACRQALTFLYHLGPFSNHETL